jgi:hypothetical protein
MQTLKVFLAILYRTNPQNRTAKNAKPPRKPLKLGVLGGLAVNKQECTVANLAITDAEFAETLRLKRIFIAKEIFRVLLEQLQNLRESALSADVSI